VNDSVSDKVGDIAKKLILESPQQLSTEASTDTDFEKIIPDMDKDAKTASEMYQIGDIIPPENYRFLLDHAKEMTYCDNETLLSWKKECKYPEFVLHQLSKLPEKKPSIRREKGCYICYLSYLIAFAKVLSKDIKKPNPCPDIPEKLREAIFDKFTHSENGRNRCIPKKYKDKLYCYIFILALFIDDFNMDCNLLLKDLKLGIARVTKLLRAIGCTVSTSNLKRKADEGGEARERVVKAFLTTAYEKKMKSEDTSGSQSTPVESSTPIRNIKEEVAEFVLGQWKE